MSRRMIYVRDDLVELIAMCLVDGVV